MKISIKKTKTVEEIIDVEFPYYYKYDLMSDYSDTIIYGKIFENYEVTIKECNSYNNLMSYEIERDSRSDCYFEEQYKSNKDEFEAAKARAIIFTTTL